MHALRVTQNLLVGVAAGVGVGADVAAVCLVVKVETEKSVAWMAKAAVFEPMMREKALRFEGWK